MAAEFLAAKSLFKVLIVVLMLPFSFEKKILKLT